MDTQPCVTTTRASVIKSGILNLTEKVIDQMVDLRKLIQQNADKAYVDNAIQKTQSLLSSIHSNFETLQNLNN